MAARRRLSTKPPATELDSLLVKALTSAANAMFITDLSGNIVWANQAFCKLSGYAHEEIVGRNPRFLQSGVQNPAFYRQLWNTIRAGNVWRGEVIDRHKDGSLFAVDEVITPMYDDNNIVTHFFAVQHDITSHKREHDRDHYLAYHDMMTRLPNRTQFMAALEQAIIAARQNNVALALMFLDLDNFKKINDELGHHVGDHLLIAVAERLSAAVRKTDVVSRLSGDEFAILQTGFSNTDAVTALASKLIDVIAEPFAVNGHTINISVSIGVAFDTGHDVTAEQLLQKADGEMYKAKRDGRNAYRVSMDI